MSKARGHSDAQARQAHINDGWSAQVRNLADSSFKREKFITKGYSTPLRLDRNQNGVSLLLKVGVHPM